MNHKNSSGFTLIELMIVVAIIGILAAIAIPAYQVYLVRAQVAEGISLASGLKTAVSEYRAERGSLPADVTAVSMSSSVFGRHVTGVTIADGVVNIIFGDQANAANLAGRTLSLQPASTSSGDITWLCGYAQTPLGTTANGVNLTDIEARFLPRACR